MRRHPQATLTVVGNAAGAGTENDAIALATARASWSRDFLINTWGIDGSRISTSAHAVPRQPSNLKTVPGWQENRRTEFASSTPEILEPFLIQDTVLSSNLAIVKVNTPTVFDGAAAVSWSVDIYQGSHQLAAFQGQGAMPAEGVTWNLIDQRKLAVEDGIPVVMRLRVMTADGQQLEATKALPTSVDQRLRDRLEQYNLVVFGYNSADLTEDHYRITNKVRKMLGSDMEIKILGYADKTGNADYNKRLSARRALAVADAIEIPASMAGGVGFTDLLFDNTTPEGRFFCRTVRIFVKSNMK
jgi:outer membrane protein OmpA-like peptidoglycan-associated protein